MNRNYDKYKISSNIVIEALRDTEEGYVQLFKFYNNYISKLCTMYVTDTNCQSSYSFVDEDLRQLMYIGIIKAAQEFSRRIYSPSY